MFSHRAETEHIIKISHPKKKFFFALLFFFTVGGNRKEKKEKKKKVVRTIMSKRRRESTDEDNDHNVDNFDRSHQNDKRVPSIFHIQALLEHIERKQDNFMVEVSKRWKEFEGTKKSLQEIKDMVGKLSADHDKKSLELETSQKKSVEDVESLQLTYDTRLSKLETSQGQLSEDINASIESLRSSVEGLSEQDSGKNKQDTKLLELEKTINSMKAFNSHYYWKDKGSSMFSDPGDGPNHCCRLDCPRMTVGSIYHWTVHIEKVGGNAGVGMISSMQQPRMVNCPIGSQSDGWVMFTIIILTLKVEFTLLTLEVR